MSWTAEMDSILIKKVFGGVSASVIAVHFQRSHPEITRNSVIGRIHRLRQKGQMPLLVRPLSQRPLPPREPPAIPAPAVPAAADGRPVALFDLASWHCRWVVAEAERSTPAMFCGRPKHLDHVYCLAHCRLAYKERSRR